MQDADDYLRTVAQWEKEGWLKNRLLPLEEIRDLLPPEIGGQLTEVRKVLHGYQNENYFLFLNGEKNPSYVLTVHINKGGTQIKRESGIADFEEYVESAARYQAWLAERLDFVPPRIPLGENGQYSTPLKREGFDADTMLSLAPFVNGEVSQQRWEVSAHQMGRALGAIHAAGEHTEGMDSFAYPWSIENWHNAIQWYEEHFSIRDIISRLEHNPALLQQNTARWLRSGLLESLQDAIEMVLEKRNPDIPLVLCHNDFQNNNMLYDGDGLAWVLDFNWAGLNRTVNDIAVFILMNCFNKETQEFDHETIDTFLKGYTESRVLSTEEAEALPLAVLETALRYGIDYLKYMLVDPDRKSSRDTLLWMDEIKSIQHQIQQGLSFAGIHPKFEPPAIDIGNGHLRLYDFFPRGKGTFDQWQEDMPRIREMGFNAVWFNPLLQPGSAPKLSGDKGSLYAMAHYDRFNPDFSTGSHAGDLQAIRELTGRIRSLKMHSLFDLVLNHVAIDSPLVTGEDPEFIRRGIDTRRWFKRHPNGELVRHGLDEHGRVIDDNARRSLEGLEFDLKSDVQSHFTIHVWDDIAEFDWNNPQVREEVVEHLFKPLIEFHIRELGFTGLRIDSVGMTPDHIYDRIMPFVKDLVQEVHGIAPLIVGETLGGAEANIQPHADYVTNSSFWVPKRNGPNISYDRGTAEELWNQINPWPRQEITYKREIIHRGKDGLWIHDKLGGTVGFCGSHDQRPWPAVLEENGITEPLAVEKAMREHIANVAFLSDSGWILTSGDEYMDTTRRSVFDEPVTPGQRYGDICQFVGEVNRTLSRMLAGSTYDKAERIFLQDKPDVVVIRRRIGGHVGHHELIFVNTDPQAEPVIDAADLMQVFARIKRTHETFSVATCGGASLHPTVEEFCEPNQPVPYHPSNYWRINLAVQTINGYGLLGEQPRTPTEPPSLAR